MPSWTLTAAARPPRQFLEGEAKFYGRDILAKGQALELTPGGDYRTVEGIANLRLSLLRRLLTSPGDYKVRPDFGVGARAWVKKAATEQSKRDLVNRILEQFRQDRRVESVSVTLEEIGVAGGGGFRVAATVVSGGRRQQLATMTIPGSGG